MQVVLDFFGKHKTYGMAAGVLLCLWVLFCFFLWPMALLPGVALLLPAVLCYIGGRAGRWAALAALSIAIVIAAVMVGGIGALYALILLLPATLFCMIAQDRKMAFWKTVVIAACILFGCGLSLVLLAWWAVGGGDLIAKMVEAVAQSLDATESGNQFLYTLYTVGYVRLPDDMPVAMQLGGFSFLNPEAGEQLRLGLLYNLDRDLRLAMPAQLVSGSILGGVLAVAVPRQLSITRMEETDTAPMVAFSNWALPRQIGRVLAITVAALWVMMAMSGQSAFAGAFNALWSGVRAVMMLQGASTLSFMLKRGNMGRPGRLTLIALIWLVLGNALLLVGCLDQFLDLRRLRLPIKRDEGGE